MKISDLRNVFESARPLVEQWLDVAEQMAALRDACREKEIDWSQVKALLKAQIQDGRDGTDKRVKAILERADNATSYADALGLASEKNISRGDHIGDATEMVAAPPAKPADTIKPVSAISVAAGTNSAPERPASPLREALQASLAADDYPDMPAFLDRRAGA